MERPRHATLHPSTYNETKDVVDRLLLDSTRDEVFAFESIRGKVDQESFDEVRRALDNIAIRSRHIGHHLIDFTRVQSPSE